jgi:hypothetical protein
MRFFRPRFTIRRFMIVVAIISLALAAVAAHRGRMSALALQAAAADYNHARLEPQMSVMALAEYTEGIYKSEIEVLAGEIALAESDLERASMLAEWKRLHAQGLPSTAQLAADLETVKQAKRRLELERQKRASLDKALQSEFNRAKADEVAKKATYDQLRAAGTGFLW